MFVRPEKAVSKGPKAWTPGDRLWDFHLQGPKWMTRNLAGVVHGDNGATNAGTLGLEHDRVCVVRWFGLGQVLHQRS